MSPVKRIHIIQGKFLLRFLVLKEHAFLLLSSMYMLPILLCEGAPVLAIVSSRNTRYGMFIRKSIFGLMHNTSEALNCILHTTYSVCLQFMGKGPSRIFITSSSFDILQGYQQKRCHW